MIPLVTARLAAVPPALTVALRVVYYTPRNLLYYRRSREVAPARILHIVDAREGGDMKRRITSIVLAAVGLRVIDDPADEVPRYVPLSRVQKEWVAKVGAFGYRAGLG